MRLLLGGGEGPGEVGDVLVVPRVSVGDGRAVGHARDLVPVVPPRHDAGILRGVIAEPVVRLDVILDHDGATVLEGALEHDGRLRHAARHHVRVVPELPDVPPAPPQQRDAHERARAAAVLLTQEKILRPVCLCLIRRIQLMSVSLV